jgi:hypothetical protein
MPSCYFGQDCRLGRFSLAKQDPILACGISPVLHELSADGRGALVIARVPTLELTT